MINLFGEEQEIYTKPIGFYKKWRAKHGYKKSTSLSKQCRICKHKKSSHYNGKTYYKCELQGLSHSDASDIRMSNVCDDFAGE